MILDTLLNELKCTKNPRRKEEIVLIQSKTLYKIMDLILMNL